MAAQHSTTTDFSSRYNFNGKELDQETGCYYGVYSEIFGRARYYNPSVSRWLSVDPLAEKYTSFSPYNFTLDNPVGLVDFDGRSVEDWFYNSKTGEVYYNKLYIKGDENLLGKNWNYLGKNGMFGLDDIKLLKSIDSFVYITRYLNPDKALLFMKNQGYSFNPIQEVIYKKRIIPIVTNPKSTIPIDIKIGFHIVERYAYMDSKFYRTDGEYVIDNQEISYRHNDVNQIVFERISRVKINYDKNSILKIATYAVKKLNPSMYIPSYSGWDSFKGDSTNFLLNQFITKYGKK